MVLHNCTRAHVRTLHVCKRARDTFANVTFHNHFGVNDIKRIIHTCIHMNVIVHGMVCEFANVNHPPIRTRLQT